MGSEEESSGFNSSIYVAVGRNVKEGKSLLTWAVENFDGRNICLVHVHQPTNLVSLLNGKLLTSKLKIMCAKSSMKQADTVWIEMRNIDKGILQLITQHSIRRLIMGAGAETFKSKILSETNSTKAMVVCQQAPISCHVWFVSQGRLKYARPVGFGSHLTTTVTLLPSTSGGGTILARDPKEKMDVGAENVQYFEHPNRSIDDVASTMSPSALTVCQTSGGGSPSPLKVERPEYLTCSSSNTSLDSEFQEEETCDLRNKLEHTMIDAENSKHRTFDESLRWWRAEEDAVEAMHKGTRDRLQIEYDSAIRKVNKYRALQKEDPLGISSAQFFGISFSDIIEATQNFKPSQKIGEGRYGSVFKGVLCHVKVAIKMLPSMGSQSDSEFKNEVEFLCRVRHPNLVTLVGACPESRSLVYEYIENGSLEDYLSGRAKSGSLSWQSRIKIAIDICSTILFLHANNTCCVHGNLKPSDILLDANFITKISDFGIYNLISENENPSSFHTLERGNLDALLDTSAGEWPLRQVKQLANLALRCCEKDPMDRPDLSSEIWAVLEPMRELCNSLQLTSTSSCMDSRSQHKIPSHFVCPIYQEVMKDPHIAGDGFTYEAEAIRGWFNSGHKTSR
ncbi:UNVERIFIED_CONTAM: U-box domain-containing protein 32 [Sesamum latifolium]|uniref:RING-type E3 ubiquitin transferase n=1 Tax=Sesamum latifolium TaxID=2727402 RepID=A0AAW2TAP6_9LAMI